MILPLDFHSGAETQHSSTAPLQISVFNRLYLPRPPTFAAAQIERNLVDFAVRLIGFQACFEFRMGEDRFVEEVFSPYVVAVEVAVCSTLSLDRRARLGVFRARSCLGEGAGFVGAQHVHCPEVLNGVQAFDDHFLAAMARAPLKFTVTIIGSISGSARRPRPWQTGTRPASCVCSVRE